MQFLSQCRLATCVRACTGAVLCTSIRANICRTSLILFFAKYNTYEIILTQSERFSSKLLHPRHCKHKAYYIPQLSARSSKTDSLTGETQGGISITVAATQTASWKEQRQYINIDLLPLDAEITHSLEIELLYIYSQQDIWNISTVIVVANLPITLQISTFVAAAPAGGGGGGGGVGGVCQQTTPQCPSKWRSPVAFRCFA